MAEIKQGYKQTDVGVIPEDWGVCRIGKVLSICHGRSQKNVEVTIGKYPILATGGKIGETNTYLYNKPSVLVGRKGTINKPQYIDKPFWTVDTLFYSDIKCDNLPKYLFYKFCLIDWQKYNEASGVPSLSSKTIESIQIPLPKPAEQKVIAEALSDVDGLIESLEELVAKKQDIKTATMQQLLTGKKRLLGFDGEWEVRSLGQLCHEINDGTHYTPKYVDNGVPFYSVENVTANNFSDTKFISEKEHYELIKRCKPEKGDILLTRIGSIGDTQIIDWEVNASIYVSLALLKINQLVDERYIYCYTKFHQFQKDIETRSLMNATPKKINMGDIKDVPILCPPTLPEQTAIATILSDMDADIEVLEEQLTKTRSLKSGMMQELLTGNTRLLSKEELTKVAA